MKILLVLVLFYSILHGIGGTGGVFPWITYEAEDGVLGGGATILNQSTRKRGELAGEASGRAAVQLQSEGAYVEITSKAPANAIVVRVAIPNLGLDGSATLSVSVDGQSAGKLTCVSKYSNLCGGADSDSPSKCGTGEAGFKFYDDTHTLLTVPVRDGSVVRVFKGAGDSASYYVVDLIDLEQVADPIKIPDGFVSIVDYGAKEGENCAAAINESIYAAVQNKLKGIFIPPGNWGMDNINGVADTGKAKLPEAINSHPTKFEIAGAGIWYSKIFAINPGNDDWGRNWGFDCQGQTVYYHDFFLEGQNRVRTEGGKPLVNGYGQETVIENLWVEHSTIGFWVGGADRGPNEDFYPSLTQAQKQSNGLRISNCRIRNTGADGINLCAGTTNATVYNVHLRSNGDDALATWSEKDGWVDSDVISSGGCQDNYVYNCTTEVTWRANGIGVYGGKNNRFNNILIKDVFTYHGIMIDSSTFQCSKASGTLLVTNITIWRASGVFWGQSWPAVGLYKNTLDQFVTLDGLEIFDTWLGVFRFDGDAHAEYNNIVVDDFCKYTGEEPGGAWAIGFIGPFGSGNVTFTNVTQSNWGGKGESFYGNPRHLNNATYHIGDGCNFDYDGPL